MTEQAVIYCPEGVQIDKYLAQIVEHCTERDREVCCVVRTLEAALDFVAQGKAQVIVVARRDHCPQVIEYVSDHTRTVVARKAANDRWRERRRANMIRRY